MIKKEPKKESKKEQDNYYENGLKRHNTKQIYIGDIAIGGSAPISIQSMTNTPTTDIKKTLAQLKALKKAGCEIARVAVPDQKAVAALPELLKDAPLPIIADIHFDYRLALGAVAAGVQGLRINPGNIGSSEKVKAVAEAAKDGQIPIRIGVNSGSINKKLLAKYQGEIKPETMVESALEQAELLESCGFSNLKISLKASHIPLMLEAYKLLAKTTDYPLHIGVTEAGTIEQGSIKSATGLGALLGAGLGDTIRVSIAGNPIAEIPIAKRILRSLDLRKEGVEYIVCPTCGRTNIDVVNLATTVEAKIESLQIKKPLQIAIMGCVVNGPGEAKNADLGIAGGKGSGIIFAKGKIIGKYTETELLEALIDELKKIIN